MAAPANTVQTTAMVGLREDISNVVHNLMVTATPVYSASTRVKASSTTHEWTTDEIRAGGENFHLEGDDTVATPRAPRVKQSNQTQIFKEPITVSETAMAGDYVGPRNILKDEIFKGIKAVKKDVEFAILSNQPKVAGLTRRMAGGGTDPAGDGSDARGDGAATNFVEADLKAVMQSMWNEGADPDRVILRPDLLDTSAAFTGNAPRREMKPGDVSAKIDVYVTNFGEVMFMPSREIRATDVIVMESGRTYMGIYRDWKQRPLAKTGDSEKYEIVGEMTFGMGNEKAAALIADRQAV